MESEQAKNYFGLVNDDDDDDDVWKVERYEEKSDRMDQLLPRNLGQFSAFFYTTYIVTK